MDNYHAPWMNCNHIIFETFIHIKKYQSSSQVVGFQLMSTTGFEYRYKVILLGDVGVGKTSLFNRIKLDEFKENPSTIGSDVYKYSTKVGDDDVTVSCVIIHQ